jgi:RimJ/RimL family protein N-acetyltransferase
LADADFVFDLYSRWEVQRFIGLVPRVMESRGEAVESIRRRQELDHPVHQIWAVADARDGQLFGNLLLKPIPSSASDTPPKPAADIEIGWHFHPNSWGSGYATEAAAAVLRHAFAHDVEEVVAVTAPDNLPSQRVCTRLGMTPRGQTTRYYDTTCELFTLPNPNPRRSPR